MICSQRSDGLGTRILSAVYAQLLSRHIDVPLRVFWTPLGWPDPPHSPVLMHPRYVLELFASLHLFKDATNGPYADIVIHEEPVTTGLFSVFHNKDELFDLSEGEVAQIARMGNGINYDFPIPLFQFMAETTDLKAKVAQVASQINWNPTILEALAALDRWSPLSHCISVHVRRGDILDMLLHSDLNILADGLMIQILQRFMPLRAYFHAVDQHRSGSIIVCTEDQSVVAQFRGRYGTERIVSCSDLPLSENQRAAMDLLLLSRSQRIIAPVVSFFSQCAASIGNVRLENTAWHLEETTDEIRQLLEETGCDRTKPVIAIMYSAAYLIALRNHLGSAERFKTLGLDLDPETFHRVTANS